MLTSAHRVYQWDAETREIRADRLEDDALAALEPALSVYRERIGQTRGHVRNAARLALDGLRPDRVEPVIKLLDDTATYAWPTTAGSAQRRGEVVEAAAARHPVLDAEQAGPDIGAAYAAGTGGGAAGR